MHRLTARFLLLFALVGNLAPLALAVTATKAHTCCVRKAAHHCHDFTSTISEADQLSLRDAACCTHDCCRAVTTVQCAYPQPRPAASLLQTIDAQVTGTQPDPPDSASAEFHSTRAPPAC